MSNLSHAAVISHIGKKLDKGQLWVWVTIWGYTNVYPVCPESYETILVWVSYFPLFHFCPQRGGGHKFWTHLKMCMITFDLLASILNNGTVNGEMRS